MPELRRHFQGQLDEIDAEVIALLDLLTGDLGELTPKLLAEHGLVVDLRGPEIERLTKRAILLQAPVASDLRFLLCVLRILPELDRAHHLAVQLAVRADRVGGADLSTRSRDLVERMERLAAEMWRRTADSWYQRDHSAAAMLAERDHDMAQLHSSLIDELSSGRMALAVTVELTLLAPLFEHLSDHAVNVADQIIYIADIGPSVVTRN